MSRAVLMVVVLGAVKLGAQASPYIPLDDIAYHYVDALMSRGHFRELSSLERPYTVAAVLSAVDSTRSRVNSVRLKDYLDALETVVDKYSARPRGRKTARGDPLDGTRPQTDSPELTDNSKVTFGARATVNLYGTLQTSARRELMLATGGNSFSPAATIRVALAGGPIAGAVRPIIDTRLNEDIEFTGRRDRRLAGRTEDGYVSGQWKFGEFFFGRVGRNWGPQAVYGLQLGNYAYTYDHFYGRIGTERLHFAALVTRLEDYREPAEPTNQRYFSIHRLAFRHGAWEIAATESYLYSGVGRGFEPSLANPLNVYSLSWRNESQEGNLGLGLETSFRSRLGAFAAHLFVDDLQIDRCDPNCEEPSSYGLTVSAEGLPLAGDQRWFASYARVSHLAYRTPNPNERYAAFNIGLGQGFSDFDEARIGADIAVFRRTPLRLYIARRRQGQGDYRDPFPAPADYGSTPVIFGGPVATITRVAVAGAARWKEFELSGDLGINRVGDSAEPGNVPSQGFQGRLRLSLEPGWSVSF